MNYAADARRLTNEALMTDHEYLDAIVRAVRDDALNAAQRKAHFLVDPIPADIPPDLRDSAYAMLRKYPYLFDVMEKINWDGTRSWIVGW